MSSPEAVATPWRRASFAAALFALDPLGSGLLIRAAPGPARGALVEALTAALAPRALTRIPAQIADDRLIGGLDVAATLRSGKPVAEKGIMASADGGVLAVAMAERISAAMAARLGAALDNGELALQRDGLSLTLPARFGLVALDEGSDEEAAPAALAERLAFWVDLEGIALSDIEPPLFEPGDFVTARELLPRVNVTESSLTAIVAIAHQLGVDSARAPLFALRAARALAALRGASETAPEDVELAAALTLGPRATQMPAPPPQPQDAPDPLDESDTSNPSEDAAPREVEERIVEAARAAIPPGLMALLAQNRGANRRTAQDGKSGEQMLSRQRGRPLDSRPGSLAQGRLALVATLRAAAPWRRVRQTASPDTRARVIVKKEDFRILRFRQRRGATAIFVVDASGSLAINRLAEVKGAIELLLADCYVRRDNVALIAFRGRSGEIVLPPTRSTARARRALTALPGGGGTPIACGLDAALAIAEQSRRKGQTPLVVLMTDGRANISRDGSPGRPQAMQDALDAARRLGAAKVASLTIDTSPPSARDDAPASGIAAAMNAHYVKLPLGDASAINRLVRGALPS